MATSYCFLGKFGDKTDYGGFTRSPLRNGEEHKNQVLQCKEATNDTERSRYQSKYGVRYSELVRLPYIDLVRMAVIDPMHNLFLGTAKFLFKEIWAARYLKKKDLNKIQGLVDGGSFKIRDPILILTYFWLFCKNVRGQLNFWSYKL